jgi:hypothetical protein
MSLQAHIRESGHKACTCGGHHYPHRPFSKFCSQNPMSDVHVAARDGASPEVLEDMALEIALTRPGRRITERTWQCKFHI